MFGFGKTNDYDVTAAITAVKNGDAVLLDVRTPEEFDDGHAAGAINFELGRMSGGQLPAAKKDAAIILYCRSGGRSGQAATILKRAGFTDVVDIGPMSAWSNAGGVIV